ncbi:MAG TPA: hypothetical protein DHV36_16155 [Desulfobacteraceae bacterium]|nr:hypothetical protein [Desulfobacteraceae bacterium]|tara:strand:+ start:405 stop:731 length:327 start_codon:yes stop_codon:yes gene_type:complete
MGELTVENVHGESIALTISGLTRGQIKQMKKYGMTSFGVATFEVEKLEGCMEKCFDLALSASDRKFLDACKNSESVKVWREILAETYGAGDEEKNSQSTSTGTSAVSG